MPASTPLISVVVATHNRPERLDALLESLREQEIGLDRFEVIVVDDASDPATPEVLETQIQRGGLQLTTIRRVVSGGPGAARNEGWRAASGALVAFTDDDCVVTPGWLKVALETAVEHPGAFLQGRTIPNPAEADSYNPFSHSVEVEKLGPWFETCNMVYPRELLEDHGGFDHESFTMPGGEDTDLAWRLMRTGVEAVFAPEMLAYHAVSQVGPRGKLRIAMRWHETMQIFARYPKEGRETLILGVFWRQNHLDLSRFLLALALPKRWWPLRLWLAAPYVEFMTSRKSGPILAPWFIVHDLTEMAACIRGSIRYRTFVL